MIQTLDDLRVLLGTLPGPDTVCRDIALAREPQLTKPRGALGRIEQLATFLSAWQGRHPPAMQAPVAHVFAGNHGVAALGVSAFPPEVTLQMVANYRNGGAAINQLCRAFGVRLGVTEIDLDHPTKPFNQEPAMDEAEVVAALNIGLGMDLAGADCLCLGEMGIANTTAAAAIALALHGGTAEDWTGPGSGVSGSALDTKIKVVAEGAARHAKTGDGLEILRRLGGRELAAIAGGIIAARFARVPVILDGFIVCSAAACLKAVAADALDHCVLGHVSREPGHRRLVKALGLDPLLDVGMALGEATGAVTAVPLLKAACQCHMGMATFAEAGVTDHD
ncbi:nicotinate-nucleotide--dimethylbenzimidazole phosphoribosyltransferase [Rhodospirillum rubrum]|uniref:nicotinate-nucleotide--dimethylbenzimidazole phosphoribosyltransferase n=1 Tax=Rhodospirillum rubrum TaxID=1085 RepID=UPI0019042617|nr:nicotinate-nucleotide--dimethylbenzimidazole phosphoribosyltransferase [Rhodospirillum rubrum]MBK1663982.1 nicotinate-nucleotide--dimethylbenzimidazole phosphoribosyltransferase [Rhodospirillum rubrum]MBK1675460.1 nicotinate-nucleotide--dimethylbenzimidazole phosphoribosyltransferase [Rhodospirillum rubrum]